MLLLTGTASLILKALRPEDNVSIKGIVGQTLMKVRHVDSFSFTTLQHRCSEGKKPDHRVEGFTTPEGDHSKVIKALDAKGEVRVALDLGQVWRIEGRG